MKYPDHKSLGFPSLQMYEFPNFVNVEVYSGRCPCRCAHCPVGRTPPGKRKNRFGERAIDLGLFKKITDEMTEYPHATLRLHSVGEPLLWPDLIPALQYAHERSVRTWLFTSAVTNNRLLLEEVCNFADVIEVSVNSTNAEDYAETKGVKAFKNVEANIRHMSQCLQTRRHSGRLLASRVQSNSPAEDAAFVHVWKGSTWVDDAFVRTFHTYNNLLENQGPQSGRKSTHEPCLVHWGRFNISAEGHVVACFNELFKEDRNEILILGDINRQGIAEIWQGEKLKAIRSAELKNDYSGLEFAEILPCRNCTSCQPLFGHKETSECQVFSTK